MKPILHSLLLAALISTAACNNAKQPAPPTGNEPTPPVTDVLCPLDSAVSDIATFDALCKRFVTDTTGETVPTVPIKGFTIHAADLFGAMGITEYQEPPFAHIRIYLGYRLDEGFKVYLVPVQGASLADNEPGTDLVLNAEGHVNPAEGEPRFVLDLNAPCPSICDINSPLFIKN